MRLAALRSRKRAIIVPAVLLLVAGAIFFSLPLLLAPSTVVSSDCIIHMAIDARLSGDEFVARLYSERLAPRVVCASSQASWDTYPADYARDHLIKLGVAPQDVTSLRLPMVECGAENRPIVIDYLKRNGWTKVLLVVDPSVTRVNRWSVVRTFRENGVDVAIAFDPNERAEMLRGWWRTHWKAQRVVLGILNSTLDMLYAKCR